LTRRENIIFNVCIDNLLKLLYNKKGLLCIFEKILIKLWVLMLILQLFFLKIPVTALESSGFECLGLSLDLRVTETEGRIEVEILKEDSLSFCGLFLVLKYDSSLQLCLAEMGESFDDLELSFEQGEDSVCFLIDGIDNAEGCGTIVRFIFKLSPESGIDHINSCFGLYLFSLRLLCPMTPPKTGKQPYHHESLLATGA